MTPDNASRTFVACSGAVINDYFGDNHTFGAVEPPQRNAVINAAPDVVTITMGGNDIGFPYVLPRCFSLSPDCDGSLNTRVRADIDSLYPDLRSLYTQIKVDSPAASVWVLSYPRFLGPASTSCQDGLTAHEITWFNELLVQLNGVIHTAARAAGVHFVDTTEAFGDDHVMCSGDEWVNRPSWDVSGSFHPNAAGHARLAQVLSEQNGWPTRPNPDKENVKGPDTPAPHTSLRPLSALNGTTSTIVTLLYAPTGVANLAKHVVFQGVKDAFYQLFFYSTPLDMGTVQAGPDGKVVIDLEIPASLEPGQHTLSITGPDPRGGTMEVIDPFWLGMRTTMALSAAPSTGTPGQPVTLTASVGTESGGPKPTGQVTFTSGTTSLGTVPLVAGTASLTTTDLSQGTHNVRAHYVADPEWYASEQTVTVTVLPAATGPDFTPLAPSRILDTRGSLGGHAGKLAAGETANVVVTGVGGVPASGVDSVVLNVTATGGNASTFLTVFPSGQPRPFASNLNVVAGQDIPNLVVAKVGANGSVALYNNQGSVDVIFDVVGWYRPASSCFTSLAPARILDTRSSTKVGAGQVRDLQVTGVGGVPSSGVGAVVVNVTATQSTAATFLTVFPTGQTRPFASNLNVVPNQDVPNLVVAKVGADGNVSIYNNQGSTDVVFDVVGWHPTGASCFTSLAPSRVFDSRAATKLAGAEARDVKVTGVGGVPATGVGAVVLNVTATEATSATYVTVFPAGQPRPTASNLNVVPGQDVPNLVVAKVGVDGNVTIYNNQGSTHAIFDVVGFYPS